MATMNIPKTQFWRRCARRFMSLDVRSLRFEFDKAGTDDVVAVLLFRRVDADDNIKNRLPITPSFSLNPLRVTKCWVFVMVFFSRGEI